MNQQEKANMHLLCFQNGKRRQKRDNDKVKIVRNDTAAQRKHLYRCTSQPSQHQTKGVNRHGGRDDDGPVGGLI